MGLRRPFVVLGFTVLVSGAFGVECRSGRSPLPVNNDQVLGWKRATRTGFEARAHVTGQVARAYADRNDHKHFSLQIGASRGDTVEIVFNKDFGGLPVRVGTSLRVCGDFINSKERNGRYPASPDGAIIHWVHENHPRYSDHEDGFVVAEGRVFGFKTSRHTQLGPATVVPTAVTPGVPRGTQPKAPAKPRRGGASSGDDDWSREWRRRYGNSVP